MSLRGREDPSPVDSVWRGTIGETETEAMLGLARAQHGVVSRRQLVRMGISGTMIDQRVASRKLIPVFRGVYGLGHDLISHRGWWWAGLLSGGPGAFLSHTSAAACWGLIPPRQRIEIVRDFNRQRSPAVSRRSPNKGLLTVHRSRCLGARDVTRRNGFPVTSVARLLLDLSATSGVAEIQSMIVDADKLGILDWTELKRVSRMGMGRKGAAKLRSVADTWAVEFGDIRSRFELAFLDLCLVHSFPLPLVNTKIEGFEVDCLWRDERLVVELDSYGHHRDRKTFETDRRRDVILGNAGFEVRRVTYRQLVDDPDYVVNQVLGRLTRQT